MGFRAIVVIHEQQKLSARMPGTRIAGRTEIEISLEDRPRFRKFLQKLLERRPVLFPLPSSTTMISKLSKVCISSDRSVWRSVSGRLKCAMQTDTSGVSGVVRGEGAAFTHRQYVREFPTAQP